MITGPGECDRPAPVWTVSVDMMFTVHVSLDPLASVWKNMHRRCYERTNPSFARWGGRGITVCDEWHKFTSFLDWALSSGYERGLSLDRKDNNGPYAPENCRWATAKQQARNTRKTRMLQAFGEIKSVPEWVEDSRCQVSASTLHARLSRGWHDELAISARPQFRMLRPECPSGHPFEGENVRISTDGYRVCRTCHRERERVRRPRNA